MHLSRRDVQVMGLPHRQASKPIMLFPQMHYAEERRRKLLFPKCSLIELLKYYYAAMKFSTNQANYAHCLFKNIQRYVIQTVCMYSVYSYIQYTV